MLAEEPPGAGLLLVDRHAADRVDLRRRSVGRGHPVAFGVAAAGISGVCPGIWSGTRWGSGAGWGSVSDIGPDIGPGPGSGTLFPPPCAVGRSSRISAVPSALAAAAAGSRSKVCLQVGRAEEPGSFPRAR